MFHVNEIAMLDNNSKFANMSLRSKGKVCVGKKNIMTDRSSTRFDQHFSRLYLYILWKRIDLISNLHLVRFMKNHGNLVLSNGLFILLWLCVALLF